ncbi:hypothetical protein SELMODRAFT_407529 [Selaginella moellendorffii]|uniref:Uncharacterized protein n=1 Tax=Selaginella moellendorffii TaxID=88036 RepID=D8R5X2_SELML|nr:hypothetical protein SELMODRAFT_407529 [Selaginella moellendorffii]
MKLNQLENLLLWRKISFVPSPLLFSCVLILSLARENALPVGIALARLEIAADSKDCFSPIPLSRPAIVPRQSKSLKSHGWLAEEQRSAIQERRMRRSGHGPQRRWSARGGGVDERSKKLGIRGRCGGIGVIGQAGASSQCFPPRVPGRLLLARPFFDRLRPAFKDPSSFKILAADPGHACAFCGFLVGMELDVPINGLEGGDGDTASDFLKVVDICRRMVGPVAAIWIVRGKMYEFSDQDCGYWLSSDDQSVKAGASGLNAAVVIRQVMPGELVCIDGNGTTSRVQFNAGERSLECGIEVFIQSSWNYRIHRLRRALCKRLAQLPLPEVWIRAMVIADGRENDRLAEEFAKAKGFSYSRIGHHSFGELVRGNRVLVVGSSYQRALESVTRLKGGEYGPGVIHVLLFSPVVTMDCCYSKLATMVSQQEVDVKWLPVEDFYDVVAQETGKTPCCACLRNA